MIIWERVFQQCLIFEKQFFHRSLMRGKNLDPSSDAMWIFNLHFDTKFFIFYKNLRRCKKVVNISDQNLTCAEKMFQNLTCCKNSDSKNDELFKVDWKSDIFWNSWFEVGRVVKTCFNISFFSKFFIRKLLFIHFYSISWFLRKQITADVGVLRHKKFQKRFFASKTFIKICFFLTNQIHFEIWSVVKLVCSKSDSSKNMDSKVVEL